MVFYDDRCFSLKSLRWEEVFLTAGNMDRRVSGYCFNGVLWIIVLQILWMIRDAVREKPVSISSFMSKYVMLWHHDACFSDTGGFLR